MTPQQAKAANAYLKSVQVPANWKYLGTNNCDYSAGFVYRVSERFFIKVVFIFASERGVICEKRLSPKGEPQYKCVVNNKKIEDLNKFIKENYE